MNLPDMLRFSGSVLGPALVAQAVAETLASAIPEVRAQVERGRDNADLNRLLWQAFPNGLDL